MKKWFFLFVAFPFILLTIGLFCMRPKGFCLSQISASHAPRSEWEVPMPPLPEEVFSQPYTYLKSGSQCWAFVSQDGKYVFKFFRMKHLIPKTWLNYIPLPYVLDRYRHEKIDKHQERLERVFGAYSQAFKQLKEETALEWIHLNSTKTVNKTLTVIDRLGREHAIPLDRVPFIIQKKAELLSSKCSPEACTAIIDLVRARCQKGFVDLDGGVRNNYGFIGERAVQIDIGRLVYDPSIREHFRQEAELQRVREKIVKFCY